MKERIIVFLFALPFAGVGLGLLFMSVIPTLYDWHRMRSWEETPAQITRAKLVANYGDSTTYKPTAEYQYTYQNHSYRGDRTAINTSSDNIGSFQQNLGKKLERDFRKKKAIDIWVNPKAPGESIINRDLRWGLLGFKMIFVIVFGGIGLLIIYASFKADDEQNDVVSANSDEPWLQDKRWQNSLVSSDARSDGIGMWAIAIIWNLVSSPILFILPGELQKGNYLALIGLVFPLAGAWFIYSAIVQSLRWRRFGPTPFEMKPFPGRLGQDIGGRIEIDLPYDPATQFKLLLSCIYAYDTNDGEKERLVWQDKANVAAEPGMKGTRIAVDFRIPADLPASQTPTDNYHKWVLDVEAELKGPNYKRQFEIPVYPPGGQAGSEVIEGSRKYSEDREDSEDDSRQTDYQRPEKVETLLGIQHGADGFTWRYPAFRYPALGIFLLGFGLVCCGSSIFIAMATLHEISDTSLFGIVVSLFQNTIGFIMTTTFGFFGVIFTLAGIYVCGNSLTLVIQSGSVYSQRKLFGIPLPLKTIAAKDISKIEKKINFSTTSGTSHKANYKVQLTTNLQKHYTLAENIHSAGEADAVKNYFKLKLASD